MKSHRPWWRLASPRRNLKLIFPLKNRCRCRMSRWSKTRKAPRIGLMLWRQGWVRELRLIVVGFARMPHWSKTPATAPLRPPREDVGSLPLVSFDLLAARPAASSLDGHAHRFPTTSEAGDVTLGIAPPQGGCSHRM